jgi:competence protein ComEC
VIVALLVLAGALAALAAPELPNGGWAWAAAFALAPVGFAGLRQARMVSALAAFLAGFALVSFAGAEWLGLRVDGERTRVLVESTIEGLPAREGAAWRFDAAVAARNGAFADGRVRRARIVWREPATAPRTGETWRLLIALEPIAETRNLAGLDLERLALRERVHLRARVVESALNARLGVAPRSINRARERIVNRIEEVVVDRDAAALLAALAVGATSAMSLDQWRVFNATGTTHLVAISGMHVTLFAWLMFAVARAVWRRAPGLASRIDREPFALLAGFMAATGYALLAGFSVPTQRTLAMLGVFVAARLLSRQPGVARMLGLALIAVLALDPFAPLDAGFWLSFVAVGAILAFAAGPLVARGRIATTLGTQLVVLVALTPLTLALFGSLSLASVWVNFIAIPVISFVFVPLVLAGAMVMFAHETPAAFFFEVAARVYDFGWPWLVAAADSPGATWRVDAPAWWYPLGVFACVLALAGVGWRLRISAAAAVIPLLFAPSQRPAPGAASVQLLDMARGSAVLVHTHAHTLLFDTGDTWSSDGGPLRRIVLPALDAARIGTVDLLVLPRLTPDRAAGAALLAHERALARIVAGGGWPGATLPAVACVSRRWRWEGVEFELFAVRDHCALRVAAAGGAVFLAGDLDAASERVLLETRPPAEFASDVAVLARGGSAAASSKQWIEAMTAKLAVVAGGAESNSRRVALARWRDAGVQVRDIRREGGLVLGLDARGVAVLASASASRHPCFWRLP